MANATQLSQMKATIEKKKTDALLERSNLDMYMKEMVEDFDCNTLEEAKNKCQHLIQRATSIRQNLEENIERVRDEYGI